MSARALNWAWQQKPRTVSQHFVLAALGDRADEDGYCYPSNEWIAEKCSPMSKSTVKRVVAELAEQGFVAKTQRRRRGDGTLGTWLLHLPVQGPLVSPSPGTTGEPNQGPPVVPLNRTTEPLVEEANASSTGNPPKTRKPDPLWDVFTAELGEPQTRTERGRRNHALAELRAINATPDKLQATIRAYRSHWPDIDCTETAIVANWTLLDNVNGGAPAGMVPVHDIDQELLRLQREARNG